MTPSIFRQLAAKVGLARFAKDGLGNISGLVGANGSVIAFGGAAASNVLLVPEYTGSALKAPLLSLPPGAVVPAIKTGWTLAHFDLAANVAANGNVPTDDTTDPMWGASAPRVYVAQFTQPMPVPGASGIATAGVDLTGCNVRFTFKWLNPTTEAANFFNPQIRIFSNTSVTTAASQADYHKASFGVDKGDLIHGIWQTVSIPIEEFSATGTGATLTAARFASVRFDHQGGAGGALAANPYRILMGDITVVPKSLAKGLVVLSFDDCRLDTFNYAAAKLGRYGFPGVLYPGAIASVLRASTDAFQMTETQLRRLQDNQGWQIGAQAFTTENPASMSADAFRSEMSGLHNMYRAMGLTGSADGSYFSNVGPTDSTRFDTLRQSFRTLRAYTQFSVAQTPNPETAPFGDRHRLKCFGVNTAGNTGTQMAAYCAKAGASKGVAIFSWHGLGSGDVKHGADGGTLTGFEFLLQWLDANRATVDVVTMDTVVSRMSAA